MPSTSAGARGGPRAPAPGAATMNDRFAHDGPVIATGSRPRRIDAAMNGRFAHDRPAMSTASSRVPGNLVTQLPILHGRNPMPASILGATRLGNAGPGNAGVPPASERPRPGNAGVPPASADRRSATWQSGRDARILPEHAAPRGSTSRNQKPGGEQFFVVFRQDAIVSRPLPPTMTLAGLRGGPGGPGLHRRRLPGHLRA